MSHIFHPARLYKFEDLLAGLETARQAGAVTRRYEPRTGLSLWVYSNACVYDDMWNEFSLLARGLILDEQTHRVVATPFPKFFNLGERHGDVPKGPFEAFEKVDGSLIIIFHHANAWRTATKGAFDSPQAQWAQAVIDAADTRALTPGTTYLAEAIYPENRIVVQYTEVGLILLAAYAEDGREFGYQELVSLGSAMRWRLAERQPFPSLAEMSAYAASLPRDQEGFVIRFQDGTRLKVKGQEYRRIHALISRCTPIAMWEAIGAGDDMSAIRRDLPEEFWSDFDAITRRLGDRAREIEAKVIALANSTAQMSDKEIGLALKTLDPTAAPYLFGYRKFGFTGRVKEAIHRTIRPTGNVLPGYEPTYAITRVMEDIG